jgi:hypothetical protein
MNQYIINIIYAVNIIISKMSLIKSDTHYNLLNETLSTYYSDSDDLDDYSDSDDLFDNFLKKDSDYEIILSKIKDDITLIKEILEENSRNKKIKSIKKCNVNISNLVSDKENSDEELSWGDYPLDSDIE